MNVILGHGLPLLVTLYALYLSAGFLLKSPRAVFPWVFSVFFVTLMVYHTSTLQVTAGFISINMNVSLLGFLGAAFGALTAFYGKKLNWFAVWPVIFIPMWAIDLKVATALLHNPAKVLSAVGGAGIGDALVLGPLMATGLAYGSYKLYHLVAEPKKHIGNLKQKTEAAIVRFFKEGPSWS